MALHHNRDMTDVVAAQGTLGTFPHPTFCWADTRRVCRNRQQELLSDWQKPIDLDILLGDLKQAINSIPERSDTDKAIAFLTIADERLSVYVSSMREFEFLEATSKLAKQVYEAYCGASEFVLGSLYAEVEKQFNTLYQMVNSDDEKSFTSKLTPEAGKLDLTVDFYQRTLAPPGAYHSEGHQDTMGLCLYLALMRQVYGDELTLVVLDDFVMSEVDADEIGAGMDESDDNF